MAKYNSALEQNISVWARRLDVDVKNMTNAAKFANKLCGGQAGRQGAISVVAMSAVAKILDRQLFDPAVVTAGVAIATVIYDTVYKKTVSNTRIAFVEEISKSNLSAADVIAILAKQEEILSVVAKGISARTGERNRPSLTNVVLGKVNR